MSAHEKQESWALPPSTDHLGEKKAVLLSCLNWEKNPIHEHHDWKCRGTVFSLGEEMVLDVCKDTVPSSTNRGAV